MDWSKPMINQIRFIGDKYENWVHKPVDRPLRLFQSDLLENFSKSPWYVIPLFWIPIIIYNFTNGILESNSLNLNVSLQLIKNNFFKLNLFVLVVL